MLLALLFSVVGLVPATTTPPTDDVATSIATSIVATDVDASGPDDTTADTTDVSPLELLNGLLTTPISEDLVPDGLGESYIEPWLDYNDTDLSLAVGGAIIGFGDDEFPAIGFGVFATAERAEASFAAVAGGAGNDAPTMTTVPAADGGTQYVSSSEISGEDPFTVCVQVIGNAMVYGVVGEGGDDAITLACNLTDAGVVHLAVAAQAGAGFASVPESDGFPTPLDLLNALVSGGLPGDLPIDGDAGAPELIPYDESYISAIGAVTIPVADGSVSQLDFVIFGESEVAEQWLADNATGDAVATATTSDTSADEDVESSAAEVSASGGDVDGPVAVDGGCATRLDNIVVVALGDDTTAACDVANEALIAPLIPIIRATTVGSVVEGV